MAASGFCGATSPDTEAGCKAKWLSCSLPMEPVEGITGAAVLECMPYREQPISLASPECCTNSCSEASLLGGRLGIGGRAMWASGLKMEEADI